MINNIQSGQRITTIGGIKGTVKAVDETTVVITVNGHGTELTFENLQLNKLTLHNKSGIKKDETNSVSSFLRYK